MSVNIAMWGKALTRMPKLTKEDWDGLDIVSRWLIATRSAVLIMTFLSTAIAGLLAWRSGTFEPLVWVVLTVGLCMAHATNNLLNDVTDHWKGVDKGNYFRTQYGAQPIEAGFMTVAQVIRYAVFTGVIALAAGAYFVYFRGNVALWLLGSGAVFVLFYTWPLKYIGLGEVAVIAVWGPLMTGGGYLMLTGQWSWDVALVSVAYALGPTCVLFGKHIDKLEADKAKKIRTMPVLLGERLSRASVLGMMLAQYVIVGYLVATRWLSPFAMLVVLALPTAIKIWPMYRHPRPDRPPRRFPEGVWPLWYVAGAFLHSARFGMFFVLGLLLDVIAHKAGWL